MDEPDLVNGFLDFLEEAVGQIDLNEPREGVAENQKQRSQEKRDQDAEVRDAFVVLGIFLEDFDDQQNQSENQVNVDSRVKMREKLARERDQLEVASGVELLIELGTLDEDFGGIDEGLAHLESFDIVEEDEKSQHEVADSHFSKGEGDGDHEEGVEDHWEDARPARIDHAVDDCGGE